MPAPSSRTHLQRLLSVAAVWWMLAAVEVPAHAPQAEPLRTPPGFQIEIFASGLRGPRWMAFGPDGNLYVSVPREDRVVMLPDRDGDGRADRVVPVAEGLTGPHGLTWRGDTLWVSESTRVLRLHYTPGGAPTRDYDVVVDRLTDGSGHSTRTLLFDPRGQQLYVAVGSSCNICEERDPRRATILRFNWDGSDEQVYATGLRNVVGMAFHPTTGELWATVNERDWLGDDLPPDRLDIVREGGFHGWPYCRGTRLPNPEYRQQADRCTQAVPPALTFQAHSAPLGIVFYNASRFPEEYRGDAFVAFHGSWNRSKPTGYKVVRVQVRDGRPGRVSDFVTGWLSSGDQVWGRPVDVEVGPDGALYVSDDRGGRIWRIRFGEAS